MKVNHAHSIVRVKQPYIPIIMKVLDIMGDMRKVLDTEIRENPQFIDYRGSIQEWYNDLAVLEPHKCLKGEIQDAKEVRKVRRKIAAPRKKQK